MPFGFSRRNAVRPSRKSRRAAPKRRRLYFDALEDRRLLSGNTLVAAGPEFAISGAAGIYSPGEAPPTESPREVAMDSAGNAAAVWMTPDANGDGNMTLDYQYYSNGSSGLAPRFGGDVATGVLPNSKGNEVGAPTAIQVAMAPGSATTPGEFVVLWETSGETSKGQTTVTTHAQVFNPTTETATAAITVGSGNNFAVSVAMNGNGFDVLYSTLSSKESNSLGVQRFSSSGQAEGSAISVGPLGYGSGSISMDDAGNFVVVWDASTGTDAQRYSSTGQVQGSVIQVNTPGTAGSDSSVSVDPASGNFVVAWQQRAPDPITGEGSNVADVYARQFLANGTPVETNSVITVATATFVTYTWLNSPYTVFDVPSSGMEVNSSIGLAALRGGNGAFDVTWTNWDETEVPSGSTTGSGYQDIVRTDIYAQTYNSSGAQTQSLAVTSNGGNIAPSAAVDANNDLLIVWQGSGIDGQFYVPGSVTASQLAVSAPANVTVGVPFNVTVTAEDAYGARVTSDSGTVALTDSYGNSLGNVTLMNGVGSTSVTLNATGSDTLTANGTDPSTGNALNGSTTVNVNPAVTLVLSGVPATDQAGTSFMVTVTAEAGGGTAGWDSDTLQLTSTDGQAVLPASVALSGGVATFSVTLKTAGDQTITATDPSSSLAVTSGQVNVSALAASQLIILSPPSSVTSGVAFPVTIEFEDAYGNVVAGPSSVQVTSGGNTTTVGVTYNNGIGNFSLTLTKTGNPHKSQQQTVTVTSGSLSSSFSVTVD